MNTTTILTLLASVPLLTGCAGAPAAPARPAASCDEPPSIGLRHAATLAKPPAEPFAMGIEH